jgi:hypothetical protein
MRRSYMMILLALLASFCAIGLLGDPRTFVSDVQIGIGDLSKDIDFIGQDRVFTEQIEKKLEHVDRRIMAEEGILFSLIAGDLTLREAVGRIRENRTKEEVEFLIERLRPFHEGQSDDEVLCRHLIAIAEETLAIRRPDLLGGQFLTDAEREQLDLEARALRSRLNKESRGLIQMP